MWQIYGLATANRWFSKAGALKYVSRWSLGGIHCTMLPVTTWPLELYVRFARIRAVRARAKARVARYARFSARCVSIFEASMVCYVAPRPRSVTHHAGVLQCFNAAFVQLRSGPSSYR